MIIGSLLDVIAEPGSFLDEMETSRLGLGELERYPTDILTVILYPPDDIIIADGQTVEPENSGQANLGTSSKLFGVVYAEDVRLSDGLYVGSTAVDPATGTITATDYIIALGGLHVGGAGDPGTDNLIVDLDTRIGGGLYVGSTGVDPDADWIYADGGMYINETANAEQTLGLTINQGANDDEILALKSSDVAHGMTAITETDTYFYADKWHTDSGGAHLVGLGDADHYGLALDGIGVTPDTTESTAGVGLISLNAWKKNVASITAPVNRDNLVSIRAGATTRFLFMADGEMESDAAIGAGNDWDDWDDLVLAADLSRLPRAKWDEIIKYDPQAFERAGLLTLSTDSDGVQHAFIKNKAMHFFSMCCHREAYFQLQDIYGRMKAQSQRLAVYEQALVELGVRPETLA